MSQEYHDVNSENGTIQINAFLTINGVRGLPAVSPDCRGSLCFRDVLDSPVVATEGLEPASDHAAADEAGKDVDVLTRDEKADIDAHARKIIT